MKKTIHILLLAALSLFAGSCSSDFNPNIYGQLMVGTFPTNEAEYTSYMMTCYMPYTNVWTYNMGTAGNQYPLPIQSCGNVRMFDVTSDICGRAKNLEDWERFSVGDFSNCYFYARNTINDYNCVNHFSKCQQITRYTEIIGTLEKASEEHIRPEVKRQLVAEARLCRANMLYFLLHVYGPVAVVMDPEKVTDSNTLSDLRRPSLDQYCQWIYDDMLYAAENLSETAPDPGRWTRDYARFCLMKHCLNEGYHMDGWYQKGLDMYAELNTGKYDLFPDYAEMFKNANKGNCEYIMAVLCTEEADGNPRRGNFNPMLMWSLPSDLAPSATFPVGGGWFQANSIDVKWYKTFEPADERRSVIVTSYKAKDGTNVGDAHIGIRWNGYIVNKWPQETQTQFQGQDIPLARWADVLLMFAELDTRKNNAVSPEAVAAVDKVRDRAGLEGLPAAKTASVEAFLDAILMERGHEFFFEGFRKIDLIRHNRFAQEMHRYKSVTPPLQYIPLPNFVLQMSELYGVDVEQTYERPEYSQDRNLANPI
ncbi:MAG: RagB/SusD family nutrient uptake outer membrane protein [Candidatus Cryptobacteroides sp.]